MPVMTGRQNKFEESSSAQDFTDQAAVNYAGKHMNQFPTHLEALAQKNKK